MNRVYFYSSSNTHPERSYEENDTVLDNYSIFDPSGVKKLFALRVGKQKKSFGMETNQLESIGHNNNIFLMEGLGTFFVILGCHGSLKSSSRENENIRKQLSLPLNVGKKSKKN